MTTFHRLSRREQVQRTPPDRRAPASPEQVPVLQLRRFAPTPKVSFGAVKVGSTRTVGLIVQNPADTELEVSPVAGLADGGGGRS